MKSFIFITTSFEGFHSYPDAPEEVAFLRNLHRHMFHVKVTLEVFHNDREVEFIMLKRHIDDLILFMLRKAPMQSCEDLATRLLQKLSSTTLDGVLLGMCVKTNSYKEQECMQRHITVEVNEDGENGGVVTNGF